MQRRPGGRRGPPGGARHVRAAQAKVRSSLEEVPTPDCPKRRRRETPAQSVSGESLLKRLARSKMATIAIRDHNADR